MESFKMRSGCSVPDGGKWDYPVTEDGGATVIKGPSLNGSVLSSQPQGALEGCVCFPATMHFFSWETEAVSCS